MSFGGPLNGPAEPLAAQDSWKGLRVDSRLGERPDQGLNAEPAAPETAPLVEPWAPEASKAEGTSEHSTEPPSPPPPPPPPAAGDQAPAEPAVQPSEGKEPAVEEEEQPKEEQQEQAQQADAAQATELQAAEAQPAEPASTAPPTEAVAQDAPPSTASSAEGDRGTAPAGAQPQGRASHTGGQRRRRLPKAPPPSSEGTAGNEAAEPQADGDGQPEGSGIMAELEAHRRQQKQLVVEGRVRQELESMLQRIEGHFRTEQAARRRTEEALALVVGERDALRGQLEAERMQQAALLQQAMQERGILEAQLAAIGAELEQTRQESAARLEAMAAEAAAWRASAEGVAQQAEQARRELAERAAEIEGASQRMRSLAEMLTTPGSPPTLSDASLVSPAGGSPGTGRQAALQFHRSTPGSSGGGSGGKAKSRLPHLKTRAIPGASLRQAGDGGSPCGSPGISALPSLSPGSRGLQRERSTGAAGAGVPWAASGKPADRSAESQRDYARTAHMARWNNA